MWKYESYVLFFTTFFETSLLEKNIIKWYNDNCLLIYAKLMMKKNYI